MIIRQRKTRLDPLLLQVIFPYVHSLGWIWVLRLAQALSPTEIEVEAEESKQAA